jgi:sugar porter (SP) family MFS transporter
MSDQTETLPAHLRRRVTGLAIAAAVGGFLFGFDSSVVNGAVDAIETEFALDPALTGFAVASALLGCALGAYLAGRMADRIGRIKVMLIGAALFFISAIGCAAAFAVWDLILWRLVGGLGIGIASVIAPAYIAEVAPKRIRGTLASLQQLAITLGIFIALLSDFFIDSGAGGASEPFWFGWDAWRWMFLVGVIPAAIYGYLAWRLPESPRYLAAEGREDEARDVLETIQPPETVETTLSDIHRAIKADEQQKKGSVRGHAFGLQPIVWVGIGIAIFQQFVGINVIFYYSTSLWTSVGFENNAALFSVITAITNVLVTFVAIYLVDKIGRKPLLVFGSVGMTLSLAALAVSFSQATVDGENLSLGQPWGAIALIGANLFVISFGATWGPIMWVLLGEMFPNRIRAAALGLGSAVNWIANFAVTVSFPVLRDFSLVFTYGLYAFFALLSLLFVLFFVRETKGRSLEEMDGSTERAAHRG